MAFTAIVEAVNCVGGKKRSRKDSYFKMIDYKSVLRNKVILMILIKIYVIQIRGENNICMYVLKKRRREPTT